MKTSCFWALAGATGGGVAGLAIFALFLNYATGIEIIQIGSVGGQSAPMTLTERMQTTAFAKRVAEKIGIDPLELTLPQYGGSGRLGVRQVNNSGLIEIRSKASDPQTALKIVAAAGEIAIADDRAIMSPLQAIIDMRVATLSQLHADASSLAKVLPLGDPADPNYTAVAAIADSLARTRIISDALVSAQMVAREPFSREAEVFAEAELVRPMRWWRVAFFGAMAGAAIGFFASRFSLAETRSDGFEAIKA